MAVEGGRGKKRGKLQLVGVLTVTYLCIRGIK